MACSVPVRRRTRNAPAERFDVYVSGVLRRSMSAQVAGGGPQLGSRAGPWGLLRVVGSVVGELVVQPPTVGTPLQIAQAKGGRHD